MRTFDHNPLYSPEKCGLEVVATIEDPNAWYEFSTVLVVRDVETGDVYVGHDAGGSCPTPFEDFTGLGDFTLIRTEGEFDQFVRQVPYVDYNTGDVMDARRLVRNALRRKRPS